MCWRYPALTPHGSYVVLSRHHDGIDFHYGRDDFASQDKLINTLSRNRAKDVAADYEQIDSAQDYTERRGITSRACVVETGCVNRWRLRGQPAARSTARAEEAGRKPLDVR